MTKKKKLERTPKNKKSIILRGERGRFTNKKVNENYYHSGYVSKVKNYSIKFAFEQVEKELRKTMNIPDEGDAMLFLTTKKLADIAYRDNQSNKTIKCPKCKKKSDYVIPGQIVTMQENNSLKALGELYYRQAPKMANLKVDLDVRGEAREIGQIFVSIAMQFIPKNDIKKFLKVFNEQFDQYTDKERL